MGKPGAFFIVMRRPWCRPVVDFKWSACFVLCVRFMGLTPQVCNQYNQSLLISENFDKKLSMFNGYKKEVIGTDPE